MDAIMIYDNTKHKITHLLRCITAILLPGMDKIWASLFYRAITFLFNNYHIFSQRLKLIDSPYLRRIIEMLNIFSESYLCR